MDRFVDWILIAVSAAFDRFRVDIRDDESVSWTFDRSRGTSFNEWIAFFYDALPGRWLRRTGRAVIQNCLNTCPHTG